ncbi:MAG TPA: aminotransferase class I/II-fold pyridoxal phosphate-dependent enzyme [Polyangiaceae bacterium]|nr:aminotransferase class I/II-fold pyridoxal phosphate-dependent enzyme [Polyangiaceae bacterium]
MPDVWPFPRAEALPTYAFLVTDEVKARVRASGAEIIDLGLGNPDRSTPEPIVKRLHEAADVGKNHRYHPGRGLPALREAYCRWYERRHHTRFDPEREVIVTMGAKEGISHLCLAILDQGDIAIVPDPCYPIHKGAPLIAGAAVAPYQVSAELVPAQAVSQAIERLRASSARPKLVIVNYPHNPTGQIISAEQLAEVVRVVRDSGAMLLHDLAYADLDFSARHAPSIFDCGIPPDEVKSFAVEVFSMSKSYNMPGWRIAFMAGNERMIGALAHLKTYMDYGTFMPLQHAAAWALDHGDNLVDEIRDLYRSRAGALVSGLRQSGFPDVAEPSGTMFVWTRLPARLSGMTSVQATTELIQRAHVGVAPGSGFGEGGEGYIRFALIEDPPRIAEACKRLAAFLL